MTDEILDRMFTNTFSKKIKYHSKILNHFWEHWDELAEKQDEFLNGDSCCFHDAPEAFIPMKIYRPMWSDTVDYLNKLLSSYGRYRKKKQKGFKKMTRKIFIQAYCEFMKLI